MGDINHCEFHDLSTKSDVGLVDVSAASWKLIELTGNFVESQECQKQQENLFVASNNCK